MVCPVYICIYIELFLELSGQGPKCLDEDANLWNIYTGNIFYRVFIIVYHVFPS